MSEEEKILNVFENTGDFGNYFLGDYSNLDIAKFIRKILKQNVDLQQELTKYKERSEKVVEYINNLSLDFYDYECEQLIVGKYIINDLLEILEDKEKK